MQVLQLKRGLTMKTSKGTQLKLGCFFIAKDDDSLKMLKVAFESIIRKMIDEAELPQAKMFLQQFLEPHIVMDFFKEGNGEPIKFVRGASNYAQMKNCDKSIFIYQSSLEIDFQGKFALPVEFSCDQVDHKPTETKVVELYNDCAA